MTTFQEIPIVAICSHPDNPRVFRDRDQDDPTLVDLAASIKAVGVLEPVLVRPVQGTDAHGHEMPGYQLCAGERRFRAARLAGLDTIPAIVRDLTDDEALEVLITENLQREDLLPLEEARGIKALLARGWTQEEVATTLGRSVGWVCQRHRLNSLSEGWRKAMVDPKLAVNTWPVGHLLLITTLAPEAQEQVLADRGNRLDYIPNRADLQRSVASMVRTLSQAPWKRDDAALYPEAGACSECPQRSSVNPGLFEEDTSSKSDRCLNALCWAEKARRTVEAKAAELREKHGAVLLFEGQAEGAFVKQTPGVLPFWEAREVKKGTAGAVVALYVSGRQAGRSTWVMPPRPSTARGAARPVGPDGKAVPKTLPERREDLRRRRIAKAVAAIAEALPATSAPGAFEVMRVVAVFGTEHKADNLSGGYFEPISGSRNYGDGKSLTPWGCLQKLGDPERRPTAVELVWTHQVVPVLQHRLTYFSGIDIDRLWKEAVQVAALAGLDFEAILATSTASLPDPKSWAHLNEDGTPKGRQVGAVHDTEPEEAGDDPTETSTAGVCRVCGCTEDNACEQEDGEPCHWVEPDLCSACVEGDLEETS